jgi:hypothetical protein
MEKDKHGITLTSKRAKFLEKYGSMNETELSLELLFAQQLQMEKLEKIRSNASKLVWWLIALPILAGILMFIFGIGSLMAL